MSGAELRTQDGGAAPLGELVREEELGLDVGGEGASLPAPMSMIWFGIDWVSMVRLRQAPTFEVWFGTRRPCRCQSQRPLTASYSYVL